MWVIRKGKTWGDDQEKMEVQLGWHDPQGKFHTLMSFTGGLEDDQHSDDMMRIATWCSFLNGGKRPDFDPHPPRTIDLEQWLDLT